MVSACWTRTHVPCAQTRPTSQMCPTSPQRALNGELARHHVTMSPHLFCQVEHSMFSQQRTEPSLVSTSRVSEVLVVDGARVEMDWSSCHAHCARRFFRQTSRRAVLLNRAESRTWSGRRWTRRWMKSDPGKTWATRLLALFLETSLAVQSGVLLRL